MPDDHDESDGAAYLKPDARHHESGLEVNVLPPLEVAVDAPELRYAKISRIVAEHVLPRLVTLHEEIQDAAGAAAPALTGSSEIHELAALVLGPGDHLAADFVLRLKDGGISLDRLHTELLEPTARHLGDLWNDDRVDFVDVTLGVGRLQRLVHVFERLDEVAPYDEKRKVLIAAAPGEQHSLGNALVQKFLRASGWHVCVCAGSSLEDCAAIAAREWFGVVGFSLGSDQHLDGLAKAVGRVREMSMNPKVGIMVGGSAIARNPGWVEAVGADGTAANAPAAVVLAKKLLAASLT